MGLFRLQAHYTCGMIFQRGRDILIEGEALASCEITAYLGDDVVTINAEPGCFAVILPPRKADRGLTLVVAANEILDDMAQIDAPQVGMAHEIVLTDIYIGEIWFAGGQSNMQWHLRDTDEYRQNPVVKENSDLRFYTVGRNAVASADMLDPGYEWAFTRDHGWVGCCEESALYFSAVAYHFAHTLYDALQVPIGIVNCNVGGSCISSWLPLDDIEECIPFTWDEYRKEIESVDLTAARADFHRHFDEISKTYDISRNVSGTADELPTISYREPGPYRFKLPGVLYTGMLRRISTFPARGMLWYQGESDGNNEGGLHYYAGLEALVGNMKRRQNNPDFAFNFVQLPPYAEPGMIYWAVVCNNMRKFSLRHPDYAMVTTGDVGCAMDIHPPLKRPIGERLAYAAMHRSYDMNREYTGPIAESAQRLGDEVQVSFIHGAGLHQRSASMGRFELVYEDCAVVEAAAEIRDGAVYLALPEGGTPKLVRYEFVANAQIGLFNGYGYPASLFELAVR